MHAAGNDAPGSPFRPAVVAVPTPPARKPGNVPVPPTAPLPEMPTASAVLIPPPLPPPALPHPVGMPAAAPFPPLELLAPPAAPGSTPVPSAPAPPATAVIWPAPPPEPAFAVRILPAVVSVPAEPATPTDESDVCDAPPLPPAPIVTERDAEIAADGSDMCDDAAPPPPPPPVATTPVPDTPPDPPPPPPPHARKVAIVNDGFVQVKLAVYMSTVVVTRNTSFPLPAAQQRSGSFPRRRCPLPAQPTSSMAPTGRSPVAAA